MHFNTAQEGREKNMLNKLPNVLGYGPKKCQEYFFSSATSVLTAFKICTFALRHSYRLVVQSVHSFSDRAASLLGSGASTIQICGIRHSKLE